MYKKNVTFIKESLFERETEDSWPFCLKIKLLETEGNEPC